MPSGRARQDLCHPPQDIWQPWQPLSSAGDTAFCHRPDKYHILCLTRMAPLECWLSFLAPDTVASSCVCRAGWALGTCVGWPHNSSPPQPFSTRPHDNSSCWDPVMHQRPQMPCNWCPGLARRVSWRRGGGEMPEPGSPGWSMATCPDLPCEPGQPAKNSVWSLSLLIWKRGTPHVFPCFSFLPSGTGYSFKSVF